MLLYEHIVQRLVMNYKDLPSFYAPIPFCSTDDILGPILYKARQGDSKFTADELHVLNYYNSRLISKLGKHIVTH